MSGKLYVVGTPIGNMGDMSPRGVETLQSCGFIAAEDTRVAAKLLNRFGIKKAVVSYYEHNRRERGEEICRRIEAGEDCALVTDAGMPAISDPGEDLVRLCAEREIPVIAVPGPCAAVTALAVSGLPAARFTFEGFLSMNKRSRREHLGSLRDERRTMVFYEAPHKLSATLKDLRDTFGSRPIAIVRELTKIHEEVIRCDLAEAAERFAETSLKGEIVLIIQGAEPSPELPSATLEEAAALAKDLVSQGLSPTEAAKTAAAKTGHPKSSIYTLSFKV